MSSEIPEDVAAKALDTWDAILLANLEGKSVLDVLANAIMAERERCARVAEDQIANGIWGLIPDAIRMIPD